GGLHQTAHQWITDAVFPVLDVSGEPALEQTVFLYRYDQFVPTVEGVNVPIAPHVAVAREHPSDRPLGVAVKDPNSDVAAGMVRDANGDDFPSSVVELIVPWLMLVILAILVDGFDHQQGAP